jgi:soluble lytic murein transglycosylase-like protein
MQKMSTVMKREAGVWLTAGALALLLVAQVASLAAGEPAVRPEVRTVHSAPVPYANTSRQQSAYDPSRVSTFLVDSIIQVESRGDTRCIGAAGERGLMQIRRSTWEEMTKTLFGRALPFKYAFSEELNVRVGRAYLAHIQSFLHAHREAWQADERSLILACYNAGPARVKHGGFRLSELPRSTQHYVERVTALHDYFLAEQAPGLHRLLLSQLQQSPAG